MCIVASENFWLAAIVENPTVTTISNKLLIGSLNIDKL